ncbi:hypothetical protein [Roseiarcus fermentans]|uniref:hypothetical protein n=1 Tax=Roseiarcus fermentans TaxID=1473586 RepID=UPI0011BDC228|nr:hypothetical protein [Roseiarcus fermentans]
MKTYGRLALALSIGLVFCSIEHSYGAELDAADAAGIRKFEGGHPFLLGFLGVMGAIGNLEDRTVLEFDVGALPPAARRPIELILPVSNIDQPGGPPGWINVFTFIGGGVVHSSDFFAGDPFATISSGDGAVETLNLDVTTAVQDTIANGGRFLAFRLSTTSEDRYFLGREFGLPDPTLSFSVPERSTWAMMLAGFAGLGFAGYQRTRAA